MPDYIQITFTNLQPEQQEMLVAHLAEAGFEGFEEYENELKAFIQKNNYDKALLNELTYKYQLDYTKKIIPEQNWNENWESSFDPVIIDDFLAIRADFHLPVREVEYEILITPKMSFGTGHHATTRMMVQQMRDIDFNGKKVFDFGTGTGILSILAEKLGAASVTAIDIDEWCIINACENIKQNHCRAVKIMQAALIHDNEEFDIILANINKNVILRNFQHISDHLKSNGTLLLSGILTEDEPEILKKAELFYLSMSKKICSDNWMCLRFNH